MNHYLANFPQALWRNFSLIKTTPKMNHYLANFPWARCGRLFRHLQREHFELLLWQIRAPSGRPFRIAKSEMKEKRATLSYEIHTIVPWRSAGVHLQIWRGAILRLVFL